MRRVFQTGDVTFDEGSIAETRNARVDLANHRRKFNFEGLLTAEPTTISLLTMER